jgi:hypothetical protein
MYFQTQNHGPIGMRGYSLLYDLIGVFPPLLFLYNFTEHTLEIDTVATIIDSSSLSCTYISRPYM